MKNYLLSILSVFALGSLIAQTDVKLNINHMQGSNAYASGQSSESISGEKYNVYRLEYYMAEFALEHDGGTVTEIDSFWVLVNANTPATIDLGQYNITDLEAIHFSIGVEQPFNHNDPAAWPTGHPLAPKAPSMHWGWSAGYRFLAVEGRCGDNVNFIYELHSLGDNYYFDQRIETAGSDDNGDLMIELNADYDRIFDELTLGTGVVDHGEFPNNVQSLRNMRDRVFTSKEGNGNSLSPVVGVSTMTEESEVQLFPNPTNGELNISSFDRDLSGSIIMVFDNLGKVVHNEALNAWSGTFSLEIEKSGHYIVSVVKNQEVLLRESVVVTK